MNRRRFLKGGGGAALLAAWPADLLAQLDRPRASSKWDPGCVLRSWPTAIKWDQRTQSPDAIDGLEPFPAAELARPG